jgi:hypothetical protein
MVFLGILVAAAAVGVGVGIVAENSAAASLSVFGRHIPGVSTQAHVFILGVIVALIFVVGLTIATMALGRSVRVHRELRDLREEHRESMTSLEMEKRQLERELARARNVADPRRPAPGPRRDGMPTAGRPTTEDIPQPRPNAFRPDSPFFEQR